MPVVQSTMTFSEELWNAFKQASKEMKFVHENNKIKAGLWFYIKAMDIMRNYNEKSEALRSRLELASLKTEKKGAGWKKELTDYQNDIYNIQSETLAKLIRLSEEVAAGKDKWEQ